MANIDNLRGIIFDYGGTLDSRGDHWSEVIYDVWQDTCPGVSYEQFRPAYIEGERALAREPLVRPGDDFAAVMRLKLGVQARWLHENGALEHPISPAEIDLMARRCSDSARAALDEARPVLEALAARYPLMVVSNFYGNLNTVLDTFDVRRYFRGVVESSVIGLRKPDPRIFGVGCYALGLDPVQVLVVGDSISKDLVPAASLGCATAWVEGRPWRGDAPELPAGLDPVCRGKLENVAFTLLT